MSGAWKKFKRLSGIEEEERPPSVLDQVGEMATLSLKKRLIGFGICAGLAIVFLLLSIAFVGIVLVKPAPFAVFFTLGNIALIASTFFIIGPLRQLKAITQPARLVATIVYFVALGLTLFSALYWGSWPLTLISLIIQILAMLWYVISHIPGAQSCITGLIRGSVAV